MERWGRATNNIISSSILADYGEARRTPDRGCSTTIVCWERYIVGVWAVFYRYLYERMGR